MAVSGRQSFLLDLAETVVSAVDREAQGAMAGDIMRAARLLWAPSQPGGKPFIAWMGKPRPSATDMPADCTEPLATATLSGRMLTLFGIARLLDLTDARSHIGPPPDFLAEKLAQGDLSPSAARRVVRRPQNVERPAMAYAPRPDAEYRALADEILAAAEWKAVQGADRAVRERTLARLMTEALDRAPRARADAPGPAAP